jgi:3-isopropylmalate/(R)-2-methylmalate dehydratase small subunit
MSDPHNFQTVYKGRVHLLPDSVDTDQIMPGKYLTVLDRAELAKHCLEGFDPDWAAKKAKAGDVIVAGHNFGCGSSRESAPVSIKAVGISVVVAESFARIFFRNSINIALPVMVCPGIHEAFKDGDQLEVDIDSGVVKNLTSGRQLTAEALPPNIQHILKSGGLVEVTKEKLLARLRAGA